MVIFPILYVYQRGNLINIPLNHHKIPLNHYKSHDLPSFFVGLPGRVIFAMDLALRVDRDDLSVEWPGVPGLSESSPAQPQETYMEDYR